jgi:hypothetical protein
MQRFLFKKLPEQITVDEYIEAEDTYTMLSNFFARWKEPQRPPIKPAGNTPEEMKAYLSYLREMTDVWEREELLAVTVELLNHHSDQAELQLLIEAATMEDDTVLQEQSIEMMEEDDRYDSPCCSYL